LEKAIEIKRRAQRCVQNGDLDGALSEYEKLVAEPDSDPYNYVLLADLLYKKGETGPASQRYLSAASAYETNGLYKNAIAVCKKMMRLSLAPLEVLERLANLHALDGLATESALYSMQYADLLVSQNEVERAIAALEKAYQAAPDNLKALERIGEAHAMLGAHDEAARVLHEASVQFDRTGQLVDADRCRRRAEQLAPGSSAAPAAPEPPAPDLLADREPVASAEPQPAMLEVEAHRHESATPAVPAAIGHGYMDELGMSPAAADAPAPPVMETAASAATESASEPVVVEPMSEPEPESSGPPRLSISLAEPAPEAPAAEVVEDEAAVEMSGSSPEAPGLAAAAVEPVAAVHGEEPPSLARVERLLAEAQEAFRSGEREAASRSLAGAARAYEAIGRLDSAATIYRSLGKSAHATRDLLMLWFGNCERRGDHNEAALVACDLGDRALNDGDQSDALNWFERARALDPANELAGRRLQRLAPAAAASPVAVATETAPEEAAPAAAEDAAEHADGGVATTDGVAPRAPSGLPEAGRVEVAVGRGEAVTFDLGALIGEFQRGVEAQLSGDAQSHYDLGMAYREMGLLEQALDSFRIAGQDPAYRERVIEMVGRCLLDQGRFDDATQAFEEALLDPTVETDDRVSLRYLLGLAHEAAGRMDEAREAFESVYAEQPSFPDVAQKIRVLRKTLESH
jgi:tetratricopeptide (TPR) repeat protein